MLPHSLLIRKCVNNCDFTFENGVAIASKVLYVTMSLETQLKLDIPDHAYVLNY